MTWHLGGKGDYKLNIKDIPAPDDQYSLLFYITFDMATLIILTFQLFIDPLKSDFWEMLLHHQMALSLILITTLSGSVRQAAMVVMIHNVSNIFIPLTRASLGVLPKWFQACSLICVVVSFGYTRIFMMGDVVMRFFWI